MIRIFSIILIFLGITAAAFSQQDPMYSQYVFDGLVLNPAYAGTHDALTSSLLYRNQWVSLPGAPKSGILSIDAPLKNVKVGVGLNLSFDRIGVTNHSEATGIYSYKIRFAKGNLSMGLQAGLGYSVSDFTSVKYSQDNTSDDAFRNNFREVLPNIGFGTYYYTDKFYLGVSMPQFAGGTIQKILNRNAEAAHLELANHYFINSGYLFTLSSDVKFKPSALVKYVSGAPVELDLNSIFYFYDALALGISYRSLSSMDFQLQVRLNNHFNIGYAYEYTTSYMKSFSGGSHELMLQYVFDLAKSKVITPRYF